MVRRRNAKSSRLTRSSDKAKAPTEPESDQSPSSGEETETEFDAMPATAPPPSSKKDKGLQKRTAFSQPQQRQRPATESGRATENEELYVTVIQQLFLAQSKKQPVKKSELSKSMNSKDFKTTIAAAAAQLDGVFGLQLIGIKQLEDGSWDEHRLDGASHFMLANKVPRAGVDSSGITKEDWNEVEEEVTKNLAIAMILHNLYILNRDVGEDYIWNVLVISGADKVCNGQDGLRKFLKTHLVDTMYLARAELKSQEEISYRYSWGFRAKLECNKYEMLKQIAETMGRPMTSFQKHYFEIQNDPKYADKLRADKERGEKNKRRNDSNQNRPDGDDEEEQEDLQEDLRELVIEEEQEETQDLEEIIASEHRKSKK